MNQDRIEQLINIDIRIIGVLISLLISCFTILNPSLPNDDAYAYIRIAEIALNEGVNASWQYYSWATYSLLIAFISKLGIDLITAAHIINAFCLSLLVFSYISIVSFLDTSKPVAILAVICILLFPSLNEFRFDIIRDIAMWALSLFGLWQFLLFMESNRLRSFIVFCGSITAASFFRAEAIIYMFSLPMALLFDNRHQRQFRYQQLKKCMGIIASILVLMFLFFEIMGINLISVLLRFVSVYEPFLSNLTSPSDVQNYSLSRGIFGEYAQAYSGPYLGLFMIAGLLAILIVKLFEGIGGPFFWLLAYGAFKRTIHLERFKVAPILIFLLTNLTIVFIFITITKFVSTRYSMLFCLALILFVPLVLDQIVARVQQASLKILGNRILILFFGYCAFDSFISFGSSKSYINEALAWYHTEKPSNKSLITNNHAIAYFSGEIENYDKVSRIISKREILDLEVNDLIFLEMNYEASQVIRSESVAPYINLQAAFPNRENMRLAVYRRVDP